MIELEPSEQQLDAVIERSHAALEANRLATHISPNVGLFGATRFFWDSGPIGEAAALSGRTDIAKTQIQSVLEAQRADGFIGNEAIGIQHRPYLQQALWRTKRVGNFVISGVPQPDLVTPAALEVAQCISDRDERQQFAESIFGPLKKHLEYQMAQRLDNVGLVPSAHPNGTGRDNDPAFDTLLWKYWHADRITPTRRSAELFGTSVIHAWRRTLADTRTVPLSERASNREILTGFLQTKAASRYDYDTNRIMRESDLPLVIDVGFNAALSAAGEALQEMSYLIGKPGFELEPELLAAIEAHKNALEKLWHQNEGPDDPIKSGYYSMDARTHQLIPIPTVGNAMALAADIKADHADIIIGSIMNPDLWGRFPVAGVEIGNPHAEGGYWRRFSWPMALVMAERGSRRHGFEEEARILRTSTLSRPSEAGKFEYTHPVTGAGGGTPQFGPAGAVDAIFATIEKRNRYT